MLCYKLLHIFPSRIFRKYFALQIFYSNNVRELWCENTPLEKVNDKTTIHAHGTYVNCSLSGKMVKGEAWGWKNHPEEGANCNCNCKWRSANVAKRAGKDGSGDLTWHFRARPSETPWSTNPLMRKLHCQLRMASTVAVAVAPFVTAHSFPVYILFLQQANWPF